MSLLVTSEKR